MHRLPNAWTSLTGLDIAVSKVRPACGAGPITRQGGRQARLADGAHRRRARGDRGRPAGQAQKVQALPFGRLGAVDESRDPAMAEDLYRADPCGQACSRGQFNLIRTVHQHAGSVRIPPANWRLKSARSSPWRASGARRGSPPDRGSRRTSAERTPRGWPAHGRPAWTRRMRAGPTRTRS